MKKLMLLIVLVLLSSTLMSKTHFPSHILSSETTGMYIDGVGYALPEVHVIAYRNPQDSIRYQKFERIRKENHGAIVCETAKGTPSGPGKGEIVSGTAKQKGVQQQNMDRMYRPTHHARPMPPVRPVTSPRGGRK